MNEHIQLVRRSLTILNEEGPASLARRASRLGWVKLLAFLKAHAATRRLYYALFNSSTYWEKRYADGGNSGAGSYGEYAEYKADVVNEFVRIHDIESVIEFGCGDGNWVSLTEYPEYIGLEVSKSALESCIQRFADDCTKSFLLYDPLYFRNEGALQADLVLSLDVLFHIVNERRFEKALADIFEASTQYVILFSSNYEDPEPDTVHMRHRKVTEYVAEAFPEFELIDTRENEYDTSISDFYFYEKQF
jgi:cyclopropane fatty-acyl-phospholipid synthase-like methyltransferase